MLNGPWGGPAWRRWLLGELTFKGTSYFLGPSLSLHFLISGHQPTLLHHVLCAVTLALPHEGTGGMEPKKQRLKLLKLREKDVPL